MPASPWATMSRPSSASGGKKAARQSRRTCPANPVQLSLASARVQNHPLAPFARRTPNSLQPWPGTPPRPIPLDADAVDLEDRADHLDKVFGAFSVYVAVILDDTAQNVPGGLDLRDAEAALADLASDVTATIQYAADRLAGRAA
jgi:hypothetical protein